MNKGEIDILCHSFERSVQHVFCVQFNGEGHPFYWG
jgi:hypothetical protein